MAGGHHTPYKVYGHHKFISVALGTTMWFWVFYRAKQDWRSFIGIEYPWDHGKQHGSTAGHKEEHH